MISGRRVSVSFGLGLVVLCASFLDGGVARGQTAPRQVSAEGPPTDVHVDAETAARIRRQVRDLAYVRRQGSAHLVRRNRLGRLLDEHGVRAVPFLVEALGSRRYWSARMSALGLRLLAWGEHKEEVRRLAWQLGAPARLVAMFGTGPSNESVGLHLELDVTLRALVDEAPALDLSHRAAVDQALREGRRARAMWRKALEDTPRESP